MSRVAVFCGSSTGKDPVFAGAAHTFAGLLLARQIGLVYGGGAVGLMNVMAETMLEGGGEIIGVIPQRLVEREVAHHGITRLIVVGTMHERKATMAAQADAFVALPGGIGTMEEILEVFTLLQLGFQSKPCALLNVDGYFTTFLRFLDEMVTKGFVSGEQRRKLIAEEDPHVLLDALALQNPAAPTR